MVCIHGPNKYSRLKFYIKVQVPESERIRVVKGKRANTIPIVLMLGSPGLFTVALLETIAKGINDSSNNLLTKVNKRFKLSKSTINVEVGYHMNQYESSEP